MEKVAVIDLGSNSLRMTVFENGIGTLNYRYPVRLAEGMAGDNLLKKEPVKRALNAICELSSIISKQKIEHVKAVATEAVRRAGNGQDFLHEVKGMTGIDIEIIDGKDELFYDYLAITEYINLENYLFLDTGGGSCEIGLVKNKKLEGGDCLPIGAVGLSERFLKLKAENIETIEKMETYVESKLKKLSFLEEGKGLPMVVLGGSNRLFGKIDNDILDEDELLNLKIGAKRALEIYNKVSSTPLSERENIVGMEKSRIDTISAGMCPAIILIKMCKIPNLIICTKGVREGIAKSLLDNGAKIK